MKLIIVEIKRISKSRKRVWYRGRVGQTFLATKQIFRYKVLSRGRDEFLHRYIAKADVKKIGEVLVPEGFAI